MRIPIALHKSLYTNPMSTAYDKSNAMHSIMYLSRPLPLYYQKQNPQRVRPSHTTLRTTDLQHNTYELIAHKNGTSTGASNLTITNSHTYHKVEKRRNENTLINTGIVRTISAPGLLSPRPFHNFTTQQSHRPHIYMH